jgi:tetratricopeptide (TPR) repeat protein
VEGEAPTDGIDVYDVVDLLTALVEKSLVAVHDQGPERGRYRLLETLRAFARERSAAGGQSERFARHHAHYFHDLAARAAGGMRSEQSTMWLRRLDAEQENLGAALEWTTHHDPELGLALAGEMGSYWLRRGFLSSGRHHLQRLLESGATASDRVRLAALRVAGQLARQQSAFGAARAHLTEALDLARAGEDATDLAATLRELGNVEDELGHYEAADRCFEECRGVYRRLGDSWGEAAVLNNMGISADHRGEHERAEVVLREGLALFRNIGEEWAVGVAADNLANTLTRLQQHEEAEPLYRESLEISRALADQVGIASTLASLGYLLLLQGRKAEAREALEEARPNVLELGDEQKLVEWLDSAAHVRDAEGAPADAARLLGAATAIAEAHGIVLLRSEDAERERFAASLRERLGDALPEAVPVERGEAGWSDELAQAWVS